MKSEAKEAAYQLLTKIDSANMDFYMQYKSRDNPFILDLINANEERQLKKEYWKLWWDDLQIVNSYDAMGVLLSGGEL